MIFELKVFSYFLTKEKRSLETPSPNDKKVWGKENENCTEMWWLLEDVVAHWWLLGQSSLIRIRGISHNVPEGCRHIV